MGGKPNTGENGGGVTLGFPEENVQALNLFHSLERGSQSQEDIADNLFREAAQNYGGAVYIEGDSLPLRLDKTLFQKVG